MALNDTQINRLLLSSRFANPYMRNQSQPWTQWNTKKPSLWSKITPWKEEKGETFGSAIGDVTRVLGTPFAAPFLTAQMTPAERAQHKKEVEENWWNAYFGKGTAEAKQYEELPFWAKMLAETPSMLVGGGVAGAGIKGLASAAVKGGIKGAAARLTQAGLTTMGGDATKVFQAAGKAGGVSGRLAQAISAPSAAAEAVTGAITRPVLKGLSKVARKKVVTQFAKQVGQQIQKNWTPEEQAGVNKIMTLVAQSQRQVAKTKILRSPESAKRWGAFNEIYQKNPSEAGYYEAKKALEGKMPFEGVGVDFEAVRNKINQFDIDAGARVIAKSDLLPTQKSDATSGWLKVINGELPQQSEINLLGYIFGDDFAKNIMEKRSWASKRWSDFVNVANAPRALLASGDISYLMRQGGIVAFSHPEMAARSVRPALEAMFNPKNEALIIEKMLKKPYIQEYIDRGYDVITTTAGELAKREEPYQTNFWKKIPLVGKFIDASNRNFTIGMNDMRTSLISDMTDWWVKAGNVMSDIDYREVSKLANLFTGRGEFKIGSFDLSRFSPALSAFLFSPRLILSRLQIPTLLFSPSKMVRQEAAKTMVKFLGTGVALLGLGSAAGAQVEWNPRSSDFGKIRIGDTRLDLWAGYAQYARFLAQFATEQRKTTEGKNVMPTTRYDVLMNFLQSKASPGWGLLTDILKGETYLGEELKLDGGTIVSQAYQRMAPLAIQDIIDAANQQGPLGGFLGSASMLGVGVTSYKLTPEQQYQQMKDAAYSGIELNTWSQYPAEYRRIAEKYNELEKTDKYKAKQLLIQYPSIIRILNQIELQKQRWLLRNKKPTSI